MLGILKNEKHKGDALLQKTYTADFLTKRQVVNQGEVTQYYVTDCHEGIIDKETWEAVQQEFKRREEFLEKHNSLKYSYGTDWNPFSGRIFCGKCGSPYCRQARKSEGRVRWQCRNHRTDGVLTCDSRNVNEQDLMDGFVTAFNTIYADRDKFIEKKKKQSESGTPLQRIRAKQMLELVEQPPLEGFVPELAQLILEEVTILGAKEYSFRFLDGTARNVRVT